MFWALEDGAAISEAVEGATESTEACPAND